MLLLLTFLIGFIFCFLLSDLYGRIIKFPPHSYIGGFLSVTAIIIFAIGRLVLFPPLDLYVGLFFLGSGLGLMIHHLLSKRYLFNQIAETRWVHAHPNFINRALEILPGALTWLGLTSPIWLSFTLPFAVAYLIILATTYWMFNALKLAVLLILGYRQLTIARKQLWLDKVRTDFPETWQNYYQFIVVPIYKESLPVLIPMIDSILQSNYPKDKIFIGLGFEERSDPKTVEEIRNYLKKFESKLAGVITTVHPYGLPHEVPGPGTNRNWMIRHAETILKKQHIKTDQVLVTTLDADFCIHQEFLAGAIHKYLSTPESIRDKRSYTGAFLYYNNYWETPAPMRLIAVGTAFWQLAEMYSSDKYMNFSSMTINMKSLLDIGLWMGDKVNDDSGFFWKAYFHFNGDYKVIPHYLPINADAVLDTSLAKTFSNQYLQLKRWAYGVEHIPFVFENYFTNTKLDFWDKTDKLLFALWGYLRWGMLALFVTFAGFFIPLINKNYAASALSINLPIVSSWMLTVAFLGLFATVFVHERTAPPRPKNWGLLQRIWSYLQWLLLPLVMITITTLPAIDAQTSLMIGKKITFRTTNKARKAI